MVRGQWVVPGVLVAVKNPMDFLKIFTFHYVRSTRRVFFWGVFFFPY